MSATPGPNATRSNSRPTRSPRPVTYQFRDLDGTVLTPQEAKALAARWKVPDEVRQRRRSRKRRNQGGKALTKSTRDMQRALPTRKRGDLPQSPS
jgi:hypothetical protein